jgi:hypothetical protein
MAAFYCLAITVLKDGIKQKKGGKMVTGILLLLLPVAVTAAFLSVTADAPTPLILLLIGCVPNWLTVEGGYAMVLIGVLLYLLRRRRWAQMLVIAVFSALSFAAEWGSGYNIQWMMVFAIIPLLLYNGRRGRGGAFDKYFFYVFYPAHIYLLYCIAWVIQR